MDAECLRSILSYDPGTGDFKWLISKPRVRAGDVAGSVRVNGYRQIVVAQRRYYAHRLAWFYVHERWPTKQIDHVDGDKLNNRIANLREATNQQNQCNRGLRADNSTGFKGVVWHKQRSKWCARLCVSGRQIHLGLFSCPVEAHRAYVEAVLLHHGEFANTGERG
jgi:hypothetical protein